MTIHSRGEHSALSQVVVSPIIHIMSSNRDRAVPRGDRTEHCATEPAAGPTPRCGRATRDIDDRRTRRGPHRLRCDQARCLRFCPQLGPAIRAPASSRSRSHRLAQLRRTPSIRCRSTPRHVACRVRGRHQTKRRRVLHSTTDAAQDPEPEHRSDPGLPAGHRPHPHHCHG